MKDVDTNDKVFFNLSAKIGINQKMKKKLRMKSLTNDGVCKQ